MPMSPQGGPEMFGPQMNSQFGAGGLDALNASWLAPEPTDVPFKAVPAGDPIQLDGEDLRRFQFRFRSALENSIVRMSKTHSEAEHDRKVYKMMPRLEEYDGQPNITTPLSSNKADGVIAHIRDAIEQRPMVSFNPEGVGHQAEEATQVAPVLSAYFEREINRSGSREALTSDLPREAAVTGTGIARLSVTEHEDGEIFTQVADVIRLENFFVDRITSRNLVNTFCAYRRKWRMYELEDMADQDYIDKTATDKLRQWVSTSEEMIAEEEEQEFNEYATLYEENILHTIYIGYFRYRPVGENKAVIWEVMYHRASMAFLAIKRNPYGAAIDGPPFGLLRIGKQPNYLFGRGIMRRLNAEQQMADNAINNHLALNNLAANPPFLYRANSPFGEFLKRNGRFGIRAGMGIPTYSAPDKGDVAALQLPNPGLNIQDVSISQQFASQATYTEEAIGSNSQGRRTLGQYQVEVQKGTIRLRLDLADFAYDMADLLTMYWAFMNAYKIGPKGIVQVTEKGKLIGSRRIDGQELMKEVQSILQPLLGMGKIPRSEVQPINDGLNKLLTNDAVPSARRADLTISLTGTRIIADKVSELQLLMQLTPFITTMLPAAEKDSYFNYHLRSIMQTMGLKDIERRLPNDPGSFISDPAERMAYAQPMNEMYQRLSQQ